MIDLIVYVSGYVVVSKLIDCRRNRFVNNRIASTHDEKSVYVNKEKDLKKHLEPNHQTIK